MSISLGKFLLLLSIQKNVYKMSIQENVKKTGGGNCYGSGDKDREGIGYTDDLR